MSSINMKKVVIEKPGGYEKLLVKESSIPELSPKEILIEVHASGVNFADCCVRMGIYRSAKEFVGWPITPGFEVAGVVSKVGSKTKNFQVGQRVVALTLFDGYSTHLAIPETSAQLIPDDISFAEAASIPTIFLTAYYGLFELVHPNPHDVVLVHSAAGGVGTALIQLGKLANCQVVGVVGATHKVDVVKKLGAWEVIDKSKQDLWQEAERLAPKGFDVVFDANGIETLKESYQHLRLGGKLVIYGFHTMFSKGRGKINWIKLFWDYLRTPRFNPLKMTHENRSVLAYNLSYLAVERPDYLSETLKTILQWFQEGKLVFPPIKTYPFDQVAKAHRDLETGETVGKLILKMEHPHD